ncbi:MAG: AAA family ATPase, partial [Lachnospiraceae bacterium]|nr:AAA family ATPase [Lachnospiraceae bacterium]
MGTYLNPGIQLFSEAVNYSYYVDKSGIIAELNNLIATPAKYVCVSRPRRFGKTMAANMLSAYYGSGVDSSGMFAGLEIENHPSFRQHLNKYNVVFINMVEMINRLSVREMISRIEKVLSKEFQKAYPDVPMDPDMTF